MKNLILLLAIVSVLFSCKKEEFNVDFNQYKAVVNQVGNNTQFDVISDNINIINWIKVNDNVYRSYNFNIDQYDSVIMNIEGVGNSIRLNNDTLTIVSKSIYGSGYINGFNNTPIEIRIYD